MKQTLLTLALLIASALATFGQARVAFNNYAIPGTNYITVGAFNQGSSGGHAGDFLGVEYSIQLLWAPGIHTSQEAFAAADPSVSAPTAFFGVTGSPPLHGPVLDGAGIFDGGVCQVGPAGTYTMQARAWYNVGYPTYREAQLAGKNWGLSALFTVNATALPDRFPPDTPIPAFSVGLWWDPYPYDPPIVTQPPLSRTLGAGANTLLSFQLTGDGPFTYQWRQNSSPLSGATNLTLLLTGMTPAQAGLYDVVVTGPGGTTASAPASVAMFSLAMASGGGPPTPVLILDGASGTSYRLEYSWDLSPTNWNLLAPVTLNSSRRYYLDSLDTNHFARFYRAVPE